MSGGTVALAMRVCVLAISLLACGHRDVEPPKPASATPAAAATAPLVLVSTRDPRVATAARRALEAAGMRVEDAEPLDTFYHGSLFFGVTELPPPKGTPPGVAARWKQEIDRCRGVRATCPATPSGNACEDLLRCTQTLVVSLRESWLREVGAAAWITASAGATTRREETFFAKAKGHTPCERADRTLRVGAEFDIHTLGSDAPLPATAEAAITLAGELAVRIAKGEGSASPRVGLAWVNVPTTDAEIDAMLGCP